MKQKPSIAFIGDLTIDKYIKQNQIHLGGSSLIGALWAIRSGASSSIVASIGDDEAGRKFITMLTREHIDKSHVTVLSGSTSVIEINTQENGERVYGAWHAGVLPDYHFTQKVYRFLNSHDALVLSVYDKTVYLLDQVYGLYHARHSKKPLRVVDFGDLTQFGKSIEFASQYTQAFDICVFGLNKDEDEKLINDVREMARETQKIIIITLGKYGSLAYAGNAYYVQTARDVKAVDTTGAGDSFLAGFLVKYLKTHDIQKSLIFGTELASKVIQKIGAY